MRAYTCWPLGWQSWRLIVIGRKEGWDNQPVRPVQTPICPLVELKYSPSPPFTSWIPLMTGVARLQLKVSVRLSGLWQPVCGRSSYLERAGSAEGDVWGAAYLWKCIIMRWECGEWGKLCEVLMFVSFNSVKWQPRYCANLQPWQDKTAKNLYNN